MGLNAFFTFTIVIGMVSWEFALTAVLFEGLFLPSFLMFVKDYYGNSC